MEKKVDPGWNDPPMLNYTTTNPPPKSRITSKRIAFPLGSNNTVANSSQSLPSTLTSPNLPITSALPPTPSRPKELPSECDLLKAVKENFEKTLLDSSDSPIKESAQLLYKKWEEGAFTEDCKRNIYSMSKFLVECDKCSAQQIKEKLLIEYTDSCEEWLANFTI